MKNCLVIFFCLLTVFVVIIAGTEARAQVDPNTTLSLRFDGSLNGEQGEIPLSSAGVTYQSGVQGQAANFGTAGQVVFASSNNIDSREGTIEFWLQPNWNGSDGQKHTIFNWDAGGFGGFLLSKNDGNNLSMNMDRFRTWKTLNVSAASWTTGSWKYIALTFSNTSKKLEIYINGSKEGELTFIDDLPLITRSDFQIGAYGTGEFLQGSLDELRISNRVRTATEIRDRYLLGLNVTSIDLTAVTKTLWPTWRVPFTVPAQSNLGPVTLPASALTVTSSDPAKATLDADGTIHANSPGNVTLTARFQQAEKSMPIVVKAPTRSPTVTIPTDSRSTPAAGALFEIPVLVVRYIPTDDGVNLDTSWAPSYFGLNPVTVAATETTLDSYDQVMKFMLEEGSRFRGYGSQAVPPSLGYRIVATLTIYEPTPPGRTIQVNGPATYSPEFFQIFERLGVREYVESQGVKEIWFANSSLDNARPSYNPSLHPPENWRSTWESNMSSPTTGDISNSNQDNTDLPIYNHTYVVYYMSLRSPDQTTLHSFGHQLEWMFESVNRVQAGNANLFLTAFEGSNGQIRGRAGSIHFPPNAQAVYDYYNFNPFESDIKDWKPDNSGQKIMYSAATARDTPYVYPNNYLGSTTTEANWYLFWYQSLPGRANNIPYVTAGEPEDESPESREVYAMRGDGTESVTSVPLVSSIRRFGERPETGSAINRITNWWPIYGDWDRARRSGYGLYESDSCGYALSASSQNFAASGGNGSVSVTSSAGCRWFASNNAIWTPLTSGDLGSGSGTVNFTVAPNASTSSRTTRIVIAGQPFVINQSANTLVSIGGRITTPNGQSLRNAVVSLIDPEGNRTTATTGSFGIYSFGNVPANRSYSITVSSKRYRFSPRLLTPIANVSDIDFVGLE